jgi:2-dehydropantoate 2-reductase
MKTCIFGAGGVGGFLSVMLTKAGHQIAVVARGAHLRAIQQNGLTLRTSEETLNVRLLATDTPAELGPQDVIIITTKTTSFGSVASQLQHISHPETKFVFGANGILWFYGDGFAPNGMAPNLDFLDPERRLHSIVGVERSYGLVIRSPNEIIEPGVVQNKGGGNFIIGPALAKNMTNAERIALFMSGAGFEIKASINIRGEMWRKLVKNFMALIVTLTHTSSNQVLHDPECLAVAETLLNEVKAVAVAQGFPASDFDVSKIILDFEEAPIITPSLLQDLLRRRQMEIDTMLLATHRLARQTGVPTPTMDTLLPLLQHKARYAGCYNAAAIS